MENYNTDTDLSVKSIPGGEDVKTFTIIAGVNGVGKSSFIGAKKDNTWGVIIDPDEIAKESELSDFAAGRKALALRSYCLKNGISFTQETTLSGRSIKEAIRAAKLEGYYIRMFYIALDSAQESIWRIANRVRKGGHYIPDAKVNSRFAARWKELTEVLPFCDEASFFDNENGYKKVASYQNGELSVVKKNPPFWIGDFEEYQQKNYLNLF